MMSERFLGIAILMVTLTATVIFCVGFSSMYWLKQDFALDIDGAMLLKENPQIESGIKLAVEAKLKIIEGTINKTVNNKIEMLAKAGRATTNPMATTTATTDPLAPVFGCIVAQRVKIKINQKDTVDTSSCLTKDKSANISKPEDKLGYCILVNIIDNLKSPNQTVNVSSCQKDAGKTAVAMFNGTEHTVNVSSHMGLFKSCKTKSLYIFTNPQSDSDCGSKGVKDWQKIAFGLAVVALFSAFVDVVMSVLGVAVERIYENMRFRFGIVVCNFCTAGLVVSPVLLYAFNKKIQVKPSLPDIIIDYDLDWGVYVTAASACFFALLVLLNALLITFAGFRKFDKMEEPTAMYCKSVH